MKKWLAILAATSLWTGMSYAEDGSSGCGPAWYILKENSLVSSALRITTNGILFPVTTIGMTVGTSNCTQHKIVRTEKESLHFATMNYYELKSQIAKGDGEYLSAWATTIGCNAGAQDTFNSQLKAHYNTVVPEGNAQPEKMLLETYKVILTSPELTRQCSLG